jgi:hypothetical protein
VWHLEKIPKTLHVYWGNDSISFLRYLTVLSFAKCNPDWKVKLYYPKLKHENKRTWASCEHSHKFAGENYIDRLFGLDIDKIEISFTELGIREDMAEPFKADSLRWMLLSSEGGLWSDFDIIYFKPMEDFYLNNAENRNIDTLFCLNENGNRYHSIGFLLSSPGNEFYRFVYKESYLKLDISTYQSIGSHLLNTHFPTLLSAQDMFKHLSMANIKMAVVYTFRDNIDQIYNSNVLSRIPKLAIGIHWYAGHPYSAKWENTITESNFRDYDTILSKLIRRVIEDEWLI